MHLEHDMVLHPRYFGPQLKDTIVEKLYREVEGTCNARYGFIMTIVRIDDVGSGVLQTDVNGMAIYKVKYTAVIFRLFKGQVVEGIVKQVNKVGIFVEVGAATCFINHHSIPPHYTFSAGAPACYKSSNEEPAITIEEKIRVKIIGTKIDIGGIFAIGTLMDDYLGIVEISS